MATWWETVALFVGIGIAMAGVVLFVGVADADYKFDIKTVADDHPEGYTYYAEYENLTPEQQVIFDRAVAGETVRFEDEFPMPRVVEKNGRYYVSEAPRYFDWTSPWTFGPVIVFLVGVGIAVQTVRRDMQSYA